jgi:hypothetical protein
MAAACAKIQEETNKGNKVADLLILYVLFTINVTSIYKVTYLL